MASKPWISRAQRRQLRRSAGRQALAVLGMALMLSACTSGTLAGFVAPRERIILIPPEAGQFVQEEEQLSRLSLMLDAQGVDSARRAELFYQLGLIYDSLGMHLTARAMFMNAMVQEVGYAKPYNLVAIYFFQEDNFQDAIEALDAALELDPEDRYINFSRALILYYAGRPATALEDIRQFYADDPNDPYRILWYYLIEKEVGGAEQARHALAERYAKAELSADNRFGGALIELFLGELSEDGLFELINDESLGPRLRNEMLCEAYFYLAKLCLEEGQMRLAYDYFRLCLATRVYAFLEYRYASRELRGIERAYGIETTAEPGSKADEDADDE